MTALMTRFQAAFLLCAGSAAAVNAPLFAAQPISPPSLRLTGELDIARLVDLLSETRKLQISYDATVLKGTVTLRAPSPLSDDELWDLTSHLLMLRGFALVPMPDGRGYTVARAGDAAALAPLVLPGEEPAAGFVTAAIRLENKASKELLEPVRAVLSKPGGAVSAPGDGSLLLVSDVQDRIEQARRVIELLDVPAEAATVVEVPVKNVSAQAMTTLLAQVAAKRDLVSGSKTPGEVLPAASGAGVLVIAPKAHVEYWTGLIAQLDTRQGVETITYNPRRFAARDVATLIEQTAKSDAAADDRWQLVVDELTGSLIVTATPMQHAQIGSLIERLDTAESESARPMRAFPIRNRPVREVLGTLNTLVEAGALEADNPDSARAAVSEAGNQRSLGSSPLLPGGTPIAGSPGSSTAAGAASGPAASPAPARRDASPATSGASGRPAINLTADESANTLIAIGEPRQLAQLEELLKMLDVRQPQVMLEVILVSLSESDTLSLGVELEKLITAGDTLIQLSSLFGLSTDAAGGSRTVGDSAGFTGAVLNPGEFSVVVRALQNLNNGRSLSTPKVLVNNNEQATFSSVLQQPFASINASQTVTTTSFGGTQDAGTTISVRPQIAEGDHLVLQYSLSLSSFVGSPSANGLPPPRQQNKVDSVATIPDGFTVVVGGLELVTRSKSTTQVPLIGSIPLVGELFKQRNNADSRSRFFVFIRPTVMRHGNFEELKYLSGQAASHAAVDDGFPDLQPRVIR